MGVATKQEEVQRANIGGYHTSMGDFLGLFRSIKQRMPQSYQHMHMSNVISKGTTPIYRDAIMLESHKKGTIRLYVNSH